MAHNKTLAAQLYGEFKAFFPNNAVEYFVGYYDYYQPEAYVAASDTFIEKTALLMIILIRCVHIIASIASAGMLLSSHPSLVFTIGRSGELSENATTRCGRWQDRSYRDHQTSGRDEIYPQRARFGRGTYRLRGELLDIYPAESEQLAIRIHLFDDEVEKITWFDPLTGKTVRNVPRITIYPKSHYVTPLILTRGRQRDHSYWAWAASWYFRDNNKLIEAQVSRAPVWSRDDSAARLL